MKKIILWMLAVLMTFGISITSHATTEVTETTTAIVDVTKTTASEFHVLIPKCIDLGMEESAEFTIQAKGNIASTEQLAVTADELIDMKRVGDSAYDDQDASVELEDCIWDEETLLTEYTSKIGTITFREAKAGEYEGTATFHISLEEKPLVLIKGSDFNDVIPSDTTRIIFTDEVAPSKATLIDVSEAQDSSIVAWSEDTTFKISTQIEGRTIYANQSGSYMFSNSSKKSGTTLNVEYMDVSILDTSNVTSLQNMFSYTGYNATTFQIVGLNCWDTSKVTNMGWSFNYTGNQATAFDIGDLSSWDTSNVVYMRYMFNEAGRKATNFKLIGLNEWNTQNVIDMSWMFDCAGCNSEICDIGDLSGWDTGKVTDMRRMFSYAGASATTLRIGNLSGWNTKNVTNMYWMFFSAGENAEWYLDCSAWNVEKVTSYTSFNYNVTTKVIEPNWVD